MIDIIIIDIETTGLCRQTSQIVNIGAIHYQSGKEFYLECRPDLTKEYHFHEKSAEINGTDPKEFADKAAYHYAEQKEAVDQLEQWVKEVTEGRKFLITGLNVSAFDMMILCRTQTGNFDFTWGLGHRFLELGTLYFSVYGDIPGAAEIAKGLDIEPEDKLHTGIGGCRHEAIVLKKLLQQLEF